MPVDWRSVPMPPPVARLPRNTAGRPVPRATPWFEVGPDGSQLRPARNADLGLYADCPCEPGRGTAAFGQQCPNAQRDLMTGRACGVCAKPIKETSLLVFVGGPGNGAYTEPPLHQRCCAYALRVCPKLAAQPDVEVAVTRTYTLVERRMTGVDTAGELLYDFFVFRDPAARAAGVLDFYLALPDRPQRTNARTWLEQQPPQ